MKKLVIYLLLAIILGCDSRQSWVEEKEAQEAQEKQDNAAFLASMATRAKEKEDRDKIHQEMYVLLARENFSDAIAEAKKYPDFESNGIADLAARMAEGASPKETVVAQRMDVSTDQFTKTTYYNHKFFDWMLDALLTKGEKPVLFEPYIVSKNGVPHLCIELNCTSPRGVLANSAIFLVNGQPFEKDGLDFSDRNISSVSEDLTEKAYVVATPQDILMLQLIASSDDVKLRIAGRHDAEDKDISMYARYVTKDVLTAYTALGGQLPQ